MPSKPTAERRDETCQHGRFMGACDSYPCTNTGECEVCGKRGQQARKCAFERGCSCWYGVPCVSGESMRQHEEVRHE